MIKIKNKKILQLILFFCISALFVAYFIQYILGYQPCNLCLIERIPFFLVIMIISLFLFLKRFEKIVLIILSLIFFSATLISFYHFGIEQGFFTESLVCNMGSNNEFITKESILKELTKKTINCKDVYFKIFGLSLATINAIISLVLSSMMLKLYFKYEKNK